MLGHAGQNGMTDVITVALLIASAMPVPPWRTYFPPQTATYACRFGDQVRYVPLVDDNILASLAKVLNIAEEPRLSTSRADGTVIIRFTWLRTFHAPIIVRLTVPKDGKGQVKVVRFSGLGGYDVGVVHNRMHRTVVRDEALATLAKADPALLVPPHPSCGPPGMDGARWLIERSDGTRYHLAERWSPREGAVRDVGVALLQLAGLHDEELY